MNSCNSQNRAMLFLFLQSSLAIAKRRSLHSKNLTAGLTASFLNRQKKMTCPVDSHSSDSTHASLLKATGGKSRSCETALRSGSARLPILNAVSHDLDFPPVAFNNDAWVESDE